VQLIRKYASDIRSIAGSNCAPASMTLEWA